MTPNIYSYYYDYVLNNIFYVFIEIVFVQNTLGIWIPFYLNPKAKKGVRTFFKRKYSKEDIRFGDISSVPYLFIFPSFQFM